MFHQPQDHPWRVSWLFSFSPLWAQSGCIWIAAEASQILPPPRHMTSRDSNTRKMNKINDLVVCCVFALAWRRRTPSSVIPLIPFHGSSVSRHTWTWLCVTIWSIQDFLFDVEKDVEMRNLLVSQWKSVSIFRKAGRLRESRQKSGWIAIQKEKEGKSG